MSLKEKVRLQSEAPGFPRPWTSSSWRLPPRAPQPTPSYPHATQGRPLPGTCRIFTRVTAAVLPSPARPLGLDGLLGLPSTSTEGRPCGEHGAPPLCPRPLPALMRTHRCPCPEARRVCVTRPNTLSCCGPSMDSREGWRADDGHFNCFLFGRDISFSYLRRGARGGVAQLTPPGLVLP